MLAFLIVLTILIFGAIGTLLSAQKVPSQKPYVGLKTILGRRTETVIRHGYRFLLWPFCGFIPIYVGIRNQTVAVVAYSAKKDRIKFIFKVNIHWLPDHEEKGELEHYLSAGGAAGILNFSNDEELAKFDTQIRQKIDDLVKEVVKNFASSNPADTCLNIKDQIYSRLIRRLIDPQKKLNAAELNKTIKELKGKGRFSIAEKWGLKIDSVNVEPVQPTPEMEKVLQQEAKEEREQKADITETKTENMQAQEILKAAEEKGLNPEKLEFKDFLEILKFVKDYKTVREGHGFVIPGRTKASVGAIDDVIQLIGAFVEKQPRGKMTDSEKTASKEKSDDESDDGTDDGNVVRVRRKKDGND